MQGLSKRRWTTVVAAVAVTAGLVTTQGCSAARHLLDQVTSANSGPSSTARPAQTGSARQAAAGKGIATARAQLSELAVKGRAPMTGYDRAQFGPAWTDDVSVKDGRNGCDTRNDRLRESLKSVVIKPNTHGCVVLSGVLHDPYTGKTIHFVRGRGTSMAIQLDHRVALGNSWVTGAQQLSAEQRRNLANDPINLVPVDGPTNESKSDGDAATWLPPNKGYRCIYVADQIAVKAKYHLWVTPPEKAAMTRVLNDC